MKVLSLFSGGGLGDYGLELAGMEIVGQVEIDDYCQKILKARWPNVPKWKDVKNVNRGFDVKKACGGIDVISGGFPCQDISTSGSGVGIVGERSGLWSEMFRLIYEVRPKFALIENVSALLTYKGGLGVILSDLASVGYDAEWQVLSATMFGGHHRRLRVFIVAYPNGDRLENSRTVFKDGRFTTSTALAINNTEASLQPDGRMWPSASRVRRVANGIANRMDRLKMCGNGQFVQVVQWIGEQIMKGA